MSKPARAETGSEVEVVREIRTFVENLACKTKVVCSHDSDLVRFEDIVLDRQAQMLEPIDAQLPEPNEGAAWKMHEMLILGPRSA